MYKVGPSLLIQKRPHGQAIVHNCSWTHCWAQPFLRARSEHRYQLVDIHPPRCYHPSVLRCQNHIFCCWSDLRKRAKRTPLPGNPTDAHRDLSIISKENGLSNTSCTRRTQWNLPTPMLNRTHTLSDRKGDYASYLTVICYPKTKENNKNTTTRSSFPAPTYTQRQWRLEKILIILKVLAVVYYVTICYWQLAGLKNILFDSWFVSVFFPELYETFRSTHIKTQFKFKFTIHLLSAFYCRTQHLSFLVSSFLEFFMRS